MEQEQEMKGGHLPAERVGGRRVINKKERRASENERASSESSGEDSLAQIERDTTLITQVKEMEHSYPTAAVKKTHEKVIPTHQQLSTQNNSSHVRSTNQVFQPRRNN